ncbi:FAD binding domain-containing protein [Actinoplanes sp. NPDC051851]|uniref:FAD binding domain-containing protein n=1 Tax=Actinoplanes sp. NPDC051851 TaxID=3154753 RepID=UPI0034389DBF
MSRPSTVAEVVEALAVSGGDLRAGGTEVPVRRTPVSFVDLHGVPALRGVTWGDDGAARLGATTTIAEIAADARLAASYPALAATAAEVGTPQIRAVATVGGNLLQSNRCWYHRNPLFSCHRTGGDGCPARAGVNLYSAVIDQGPCVAPHPSSLATALLAYGAGVEVHGRGRITLGELYGDGSDPTRDHTLADRDVLVAVGLPAPVAGERAGYLRVAARADGDWPLLEVVARLVVAESVITVAAVTAGGVARTPVRLGGVEAALIGRAADPEVLHAAAAHAGEGCTPLAQNGYKVGLLRDATLEVLMRSLPCGS